MKDAGAMGAPPLPSSGGSLNQPEADANSRPYTLQFVSASCLRTIPLPRGVVLRIGRNADSDVVLDHPSASDDHAVIHGGDPPELEDLRSDEGTRVHGSRIASGRRVALKAGSIIEIADARFHVRQPGARSTPTHESGAGADSLSPPGRRGRVVVRDPTMINLYQLAERLATSGIAVLVLGETGVGKQLVAERIHTSSDRRDRPLVRINCAALSDGVLLSELFGHERGAFTGAHATKIGLFEAAHSGTVFLDEIGELSPEAQAKLLRVLETGEIIRVGSHRTRRVDVRVVSATNRELPRLVANGNFRSDLFFRLNGVTLVVPPLRERPLDIVPLAEFFAQSYAALMGFRCPQLTDDAKVALHRYPWPGNVRELKNTIERAVVLAQGALIDVGTIKFDFGVPSFSGTTAPMSTLPEPVTASSFVPPDAAMATAVISSGATMPPQSLRVVGKGLHRSSPAPAPVGMDAAQRAEKLRAELVRAERDRIIEALQQAGNQAAAAKLLGLSRRALIYRLEAYQIPRPRKRTPTSAKTKR
jgi:transcriptional regulator with GAF, ATPase, and Fis domain